MLFLMLVTHLSLHTQGHQHHILPSRPIGVQCSRVCVTGMERREWNHTPMPNFLSAYTHHTPFFCRSQSLFVRMSTTDLPPSIHHTTPPPTTTIRRRALAIARQGPLMRAAPFYSLSTGELITTTHEDGTTIPPQLAVQFGKRAP